VARDIQRARRTKSKEFHPDSLPEGDQAANLEQMKRINAAADDLLEYCAEFGTVAPTAGTRGADARPRSRDQQYDFWRDQWRYDASDRQERRAQARAEEERRRAAENERMRREYEEYRERRRRSHSEDERRQREYERAQAEMRRAQSELEALRSLAADLQVRWEEARARLDSATSAFIQDPSSDSALWRLYGGLLGCFPLGDDLRATAERLTGVWEEYGRPLGEGGFLDVRGWDSFTSSANERALASRQFTVTLGREIEGALKQALVAADERMVTRTSPASRRALGALLEIRRVLGLDDDEDHRVATFWTAPGAAPLHLSMGAVHSVKSDKGYAFVKPFGGGKDVFVHAKALPGGDFERLMADSVVTFRTKETDKGFQATDVEFVTTSM
jgi:cold shock CspA family protein